MPPQTNASAGPSNRPKPFASADHRPEAPDGLFRVLIISSGSVASIKIPDIVGALSKVRLQVAATSASTHFYTQQSVDDAIKSAKGKERASAMDIDGAEEQAVKVWTDEDEWADWKKVGDPILHIELRRWADLVVVAPCSADFLAKLAAGFCDNLPLSVMRALPPGTPVVLCPAMNTMMYEHAFTADHLRIVQEKLGYLVLGPQGAGMLACGDAGVGKMTDWRDIVSMIESLCSAFLSRPSQQSSHPSSQQGQAASASVTVQTQSSDPFRNYEPGMSGALDYRFGKGPYKSVEESLRDSDGAPKPSAAPIPTQIQDPFRGGPPGLDTLLDYRVTEASGHPLEPSDSSSATTSANPKSNTQREDPYKGWDPAMMAGLDYRVAGSTGMYKPVEAFQYTAAGEPTFAGVSAPRPNSAPGRDRAAGPSGGGNNETQSQTQPQSSRARLHTDFYPHTEGLSNGDGVGKEGPRLTQKRWIEDSYPTTSWGAPPADQGPDPAGKSPGKRGRQSSPGTDWYKSGNGEFDDFRKHFLASNTEVPAEGGSSAPGPSGSKAQSGEGEWNKLGHGEFYDFRRAVNKEFYAEGLSNGAEVGKAGPSWTNEAFKTSATSVKEHMESMTSANGGEGTLWARKFWMG